MAGKRLSESLQTTLTTVNKMAKLSITIYFLITHSVIELCWCTIKMSLLHFLRPIDMFHSIYGKRTLLISSGMWRTECIWTPYINALRQMWMCSCFCTCWIGRTRTYVLLTMLFRHQDILLCSHHSNGCVKVQTWFSIRVRPGYMLALSP